MGCRTGRVLFWSVTKYASGWWDVGREESAEQDFFELSSKSGGERRGRGSAIRSSLKGRESTIVSQTNTGLVLKETLGTFLRDGWSACGLFRAHRCHPELKRTD